MRDQLTEPGHDAAPIRLYSEEGPSQLSNGLLLRSDFHRLFDLGYVTVTPELKVEVSRSMKEEWFNGKAYCRLDGARLESVPIDPWAKPAARHLMWHNENRSIGR